MTSIHLRKPGALRALLSTGVAPVVGLLGSLTATSTAHADPRDDAAPPGSPLLTEQINRGIEQGLADPTVLQ